MRQGETPLARVKVTLQKDLENLSRDGSVPLAHLWLGSALVRSTGRKWVSRDAQLHTGWKLSVTNKLWDSGWERKTQI